MSDDDNPLAWPDDKWLTRAEASRYARALGIRLAVSTLAKRACRGDGPPVKRLGKRVYYRLGDLRAWLRDNIR